MKRNENYGSQIADALARCAPLAEPSPERDALWLVVQALLCTTAQRSVTPLGSSMPVVVTAEYADQELVVAMQWLADHEDDARRMEPADLYRRMRSAATKGMYGSARAAQTDALHGITHVPAGQSLHFDALDVDEPVAS